MPAPGAVLAVPAAIEDIRVGQLFSAVFSTITLESFKLLAGREQSTVYTPSPVLVYYDPTVYNAVYSTDHAQSPPGIRDAPCQPRHGLASGSSSIAGHPL